MNAKTVLQTMELIAYELAEAETLGRKALKHRANAMRMLGAMHREFSHALDEAKSASKISARQVAVPEETSVAAGSLTLGSGARRQRIIDTK